MKVAEAGGVTTLVLHCQIEYALARRQISGLTGRGHRARARAMSPAPDRIPPG
jgi:hypothetical protein